jgi:hypothetical protein
MSGQKLDLDCSMRLLQHLRDGEHVTAWGIDKVQLFKKMGKLYTDRGISISLCWFVRYGMLTQVCCQVNKRQHRFYRLAKPYNEIVNWLHRVSLNEHEDEDDGYFEGQCKGVTEEDLAWMEKYRHQFQMRQARRLAESRVSR